MSGKDIKNKGDFIKLTDLHCVTFQCNAQRYQQGTDISLLYNINQSFVPTPHDWIGLYRQDWQHPNDYVTYEWVPKSTASTDLENSRSRSILFAAKNIRVKPDDDFWYKFMYINKEKHVIGISSSFQFKSKLTPLEDDEFTVLDVEKSDDKLDAVCGFTVVEDEKKEGSISRESSFELITEGEDDCPPELKIENLPKTVPPISANPTKETKENAGATATERPRSPTPFETKQKAAGEKKSKGKKKLAKAKKSQDKPGISIKLDNKPSTESKATNAKETITLAPLVVKNTSSPAPCSSLSSENSQQEPSTLAEKLTKIAQKSWNADCETCDKVSSDMKLLKEKYDAVIAEKEQYLTELNDTEEAMQLRTILINELSKQVKDLVHENNGLSNVLENSKKETKDVSKMEHLLKENRKLHEKSNSLVTQVRKLKDKAKYLEEGKKESEEKLDHKEEISTKLRSDKKKLEERLGAINSSYIELEHHLDNIMYSLSTKGVKKIVSSSGNDIDLSNCKEGSVIELDGWAVSKSKRTERYLSTIASHEDTISKLNEQCEVLKDQIRQSEGKIIDLDEQCNCDRNRSVTFQQKILELTSHTKALEEKLAALSTILQSEKYEKANRVRDLKLQLEVSQTKIMQLKEALSKTGSRRNLGRPTYDQGMQTTKVRQDSKGIQSDASLPTIAHRTVTRETGTSDHTTPVAPTMVLYSNGGDRLVPIKVSQGKKQTADKFTEPFVKSEYCVKTEPLGKASSLPGNIHMRPKYPASADSANSSKQTSNQSLVSDTQSCPSGPHKRKLVGEQKGASESKIKKWDKSPSDKSPCRVRVIRETSEPFTDNSPPRVRVVREDSPPMTNGLRSYFSPTTNSFFTTWLGCGYRPNVSPATSPIRITGTEGLRSEASLEQAVPDDSNASPSQTKSPLKTPIQESLSDYYTTTDEEGESTEDEIDNCPIAIPILCQPSSLPPGAFFGASMETKSKPKVKKLRKPRKFVFKVHNAGQMGGENPPEYTPRIYGAKPKTGSIPKKCPHCGIDFPARLTQARFDKHMESHSCLQKHESQE